ncbi:RND transporter [Halioglobus japonicus]|uniref:Efflux pump membrane transporter n=1 Tax=Halioglobus japonicus TaxID=930805 RepID=A0AAP8SMM4_9GAMM|nr:multidrug efflux RND transporter permease subunit [Halioglobus japonicus]AQA17785.1 RND transporter [Halioglobus japonicus]PLW85740.1 hydrophobe/amphiphile efflux-1 family RND transporter [Halioglobus japonicus]GHD17266.1 transporter [Halioglobus japonicus]
MFSAFFIDRPKFAIVIAIVLTLAGGLSIYALPVNEYPAISPPSIMVSGVYPGASAEIVETTVGTPIEDAVNGVEDMIYMSSKSANDGSYALTVTFEVGSDPDMALVRVQNRVKLAEPSLPAEVTAMGLNISERSPDMLKLVSFTAPGGKLDYKFVSNYVKINLQSALARLPGVSEATILGEADYAMRLWLNPDKMAIYELSVNEVYAALHEQNVQVAAGKIGAPPFEGPLQSEFTLQTKGRLQEVEEFENIVLRATADGSAIFLKDIARVELGQSAYNFYGETNGVPAVNLAIYQLADANALEVGAEVDALLEQMSKDFPEGMDYLMPYDTTRYVSTAVSQVVSSLFEAVGLVILVTFIFLGSFRATLVPAVAIPVSLVATFAILLATGMTINTVTLFGLILAIGIVVDDAILVIENCDRHLREDPTMSPTDAAKITMHEVGSAIVATTLVLLAVFVPVAMLPGITGVMYQQFAVTICVAVLFSSVNALTLSPALCSLLLKSGERAQAAWYQRFLGGFGRLTNSYDRGVGWLLGRLRMTAMVFMGLTAAVVFGFMTTPTGFVPDEDKGSMMVSVQLPDGSSLLRTKEVMDKLSGLISKNPAVETVTAVSGFSLLSGAMSSNGGTLFVGLKPWEEREDFTSSSFGVAQTINAQGFQMVPEAQVFALTPPSVPGMGASGGLEVVLQDTLSRSSQELASALNHLIVEANHTPALQSVFSTYRANVPQYFVDVDRVKAKNLGVSLDEIFATLQAQMGSLYINDFNKFGQTYRVIMQAESTYRSDLSDLDRFYVKSGAGEMVPLSTLVTTRPILGPDISSRYNLFRSATVQASAAPGYSTGQAMAAMEKLARETLPAGYNIDWTGMSYQERKAGSAAIYAYLLALIFVYLFLVAQYESWSIPAAILLVVPIAIGGAITSLILSGIALNMYAQIGIVLLIGMCAKTAILMVEFARQKREQDGEEILVAARDAAKLRFRAVCMTGISFVLGILPLVLASGAGAAGQRALGMTVFGGMLATMVLGVYFVPAFYAMVQGTRERLKTIGRQ